MSLLEHMKPVKENSLLFEPKDVGAPVEISLQHQGYAQLLAHEIAHQDLNACLRCAVEEIVGHFRFPKA